MLTAQIDCFLQAAACGEAGTVESWVIVSFGQGKNQALPEGPWYAGGRPLSDLVFNLIQEP